MADNAPSETIRDVIINCLVKAGLTEQAAEVRWLVASSDSLLDLSSDSLLNLNSDITLTKKGQPIKASDLMLCAFSWGAPPGPGYWNEAHNILIDKGL